MGTSIGLNLLNFFNFFAFKMEKFHFSPENRTFNAIIMLKLLVRKSEADKSHLGVPIDSAGKNTPKYVLWICGKFFLAKL